MSNDKYLDLSQRCHHQPGLEPSASHPYSGIEFQSDPAHAYTQPHNAQQQWAQVPSASLTAGEKNGPISTADNHNRRVLGLRVPVFWGLLVALILIVAGAIGGGIGGRIGGGLATQEHNNNGNQDSSGSTRPASDAGDAASKPPAQKPTTTEGTITITLPIVQPWATPVDGGCPRINGTRYTPQQAANGTVGAITLQGQTTAQSFIQLCDTNFPEGESDPGVHDIAVFDTATFEQCMTLCADWNRQHGETGYCMAATIAKIGKFPRAGAYQKRARSWQSHLP
ncbi:uncharacterized protein PG986_009969 [Apiospora aurea]|uniref:Apple domain-containing protein n=1 Tax=Apiospora aurea TaxID=335848 RepID=A0ABR1Q965_9PEZI